MYSLCMCLWLCSSMCAQRHDVIITTMLLHHQQSVHIVCDITCSTDIEKERIVVNYFIIN